MYNVKCTRYKIQDTSQDTRCNMQYAIYNIQYTIYNIQYTLYNIQYTIYNIQYTIYMFSWQFVKSCSKLNSSPFSRISVRIMIISN